MELIGRKLIDRAGKSFALVSTLLTFSQAHAARIPPRQSVGPERIRVRIAESVSQASVRGYDLQIFETQSGLLSGRHLAATPPQSSEWKFRCQDNRIRAVPEHGATLTLKSPVAITSPAGMIRIGEKPYRDEIQIHAVGSLCEVVNELDLEKYLGGIVNAEFNSQWSAEAVQAQVIAARTYALYQIRQGREKVARGGKKARFDVDATVSDQVYDGFGKEDYRGSRAVEKTRGKVLLARNDSGRLEPIKAFYHSSCAGETLLPQEVWGQSFAGFRHRALCPYCAMSAKIGWNLRLSLREAAASIRQGAQAEGQQPRWPSFWKRVVTEGQLVDLRLGARDGYADGARISTVQTMWSWSNRWIELPLSAVRLRDWIGPARMKSTAFQVALDSANGRLSFSGRGNGHGVGMCQLGAKYLGERGLTADAILKHYYPDALLEKLW